MKDIRTNQGSLLLRVLCGGYLVYLAYDLITAQNRTPLIIAASVLFFLVGGAVFALSLRSLLMNEYGPQNQQKTEDTEDEDNDQ